jgi:hypothetical protein
MLSTIQATFDKSKLRYVKAVMKRLKLDEDTSVKRISMGQLFNEMTACIIVPEEKLRITLQILIANDIKIYSFDSEYKKVVDEIMQQPKGESYYQKSSIDKASPAIQEPFEKILFEPKISKKVKKDLSDRLTAAVKSIEQKGGPDPIIEDFVKEGNYKAIKNWILNNPLHNQEASIQYIQAIRNFIIINKRKGMNNSSYIDTAILKLSEVVADQDIKSITSEDFINSASNAILALSSEINPESLINVINMPNVSQKLNVMAAIKLSEIIFDNGPIDQNLLAQTAKQINRRYLMLSYDVMEPVISEINKSKFNRLIDSITKLRNG